MTGTSFLMSLATAILLEGKKGRCVAMLQLNTTETVYAYGGSLGACSIAVNLCTNALPGVDRNDVIAVFDQEGDRTELERLLSVARKGDHLVLASLFALDDPDNEMAMVHRLHKLRRKGVEIHTVLGPSVSVVQYDEMLKIWHLLQKQKREFLICCGVRPQTDAVCGRRF